MLGILGDSCIGLACSPHRSLSLYKYCVYVEVVYKIK